MISRSSRLQQALSSFVGWRMLVPTVFATPTTRPTPSMEIRRTRGRAQASAVSRICSRTSAGSRGPPTLASPSFIYDTVYTLAIQRLPRSSGTPRSWPASPGRSAAGRRGCLLHGRRPSGGPPVIPKRHQRRPVCPAPRRGRQALELSRPTLAAATHPTSRRAAPRRGADRGGGDPRRPAADRQEKQPMIAVYGATWPAADTRAYIRYRI